MYQLLAGLLQTFQDHAATAYIDLGGVQCLLQVCHDLCHGMQAVDAVTSLAKHCAQLVWARDAASLQPQLPLMVRSGGYVLCWRMAFVTLLADFSQFVVSVEPTTCIQMLW